ncbi:TetR/AcrR family transcriptional regulator [Cellulomonas cellasea]|uniref:TetR/AcrR family transcriptional regulator n=1 Tax=Cellulomonas cellasea TaxID=43670 RepID=UPI0025A3E52B|nr:TetR/AcrR family transcriptional regulator [Cellulomonas cellasea]MDM8084335.1 TetR/AcrR family transcriptional regulator [Cellulomonas cellasea]
MTSQIERGYAKGRARRQQILDEAMALFGDVGYRAASLREIAARAGISHPGLLHHFTSKESLLLAVLERRDETDSAQFDLTASTGTEVLRHMLDLADYNATRPGIVELSCVLAAEATSPDHPAHEFFTDRYERAVRLCIDAFEEARDAGQLNPDVDPEHAARSFIALMDGLQVQWLLDREGVDMAGTLREHLSRQLKAGF